MYEYHYWANGLLFRAAAELTDAEFTAPLPHWPRGGVRGTLAHMLSADRGWRVRCQTGESPERTTEDMFPSLSDLTATYAEEQERMLAYVGGLSEEQLAGQVSYSFADKIEKTNTLWQLLMHVVNHGMQHRSEVAQMLTEFGHSPGDIDMFYFWNELDAKG